MSVAAWWRVVSFNHRLSDDVGLDSTSYTDRLETVKSSTAARSRPYQDTKGTLRVDFFYSDISDLSNVTTDSTGE